MTIYHHGFQFNSLGSALENYSIDLSAYVGKTVLRLDIVAAMDSLGPTDIQNGEVLVNCWIGPNPAPDNCTTASATITPNSGDGGHMGPYTGFDNIIWSTILKTGTTGHDRDQHPVKPNHVIMPRDHLWFQLNSNDPAHRIDGEVQYTISIG